ncbi:hypothetical protein CB1_000755012 [Camelus ferus]|nr:hypothetical protein CB1_000755012 [Camelus ferus]
METRLRANSSSLRRFLHAHAALTYSGPIGRDRPYPEPSARAKPPGSSAAAAIRELCIVVSWRRGAGITKPEDPGPLFSHVDTYGAREIRRGIWSTVVLEVPLGGSGDGQVFLLHLGDLLGDHFQLFRGAMLLLDSQSLHSLELCLAGPPSFRFFSWKT